MTVELTTLYGACDPSVSLNIKEYPEHRKYYIDFSTVRAKDMLRDMCRRIELASSQNQFACQLFTGHIGCGKSTELLRLKSQLEENGFHVIYFEASKDLEMADVEVSDILTVISLNLNKELGHLGIQLNEEGRFGSIFQELFKIVREIGIPIPFTPLSINIFNLIGTAKDSPKVRDKMHRHLEPQKTQMSNALNKELLEPALERLRQDGKKGLVVIADNLDRIQSTPKGGKTQAEYLFADQGDKLRLNCHIIYTIPPGLNFSNDFALMVNKFGRSPHVLPTVPISHRDNKEHQQGLELLRQMVLSRAFPDETENQRHTRINEVFDSSDTLHRLCCVSGGHVRNILILLGRCIEKTDELPISQAIREQVIREWRNEIVLGISDHQWELLKKVRKDKKIVARDKQYQDLLNQDLLRMMLIFEYREDNIWFDINPILAEAEELS